MLHSPTFPLGSKWAVLAAGFLIVLASLLSTGAQAAAVRQKLLMDSGWKFYEEPTPISFPDWGTPDTSWEVTMTGVNANTTPATIAAENPAPTWTPYTIGTDAFNGQVGYAYFQSTITGGGPAPATIQFTSVDDNAWVWLNGVYLGDNFGWDLPFGVTPGAAWNTSGPNVLQVLNQNTAGPGGIYGSVTFVGSTPTPSQAAPDFDDSTWQTVHLPHDYVVKGVFSSSADTGHGSLPVTTAWYRNTFTVPSTDAGKDVWIDFDGVYRDAWVWVNGNFIGENKSGYSGFRYDLTPYLNYGGTNVVAVHVDPTFFEGWWYEGGGIYRHVWLNVADPVHVAPDGTFVTSNVNLAGPSATINIQTQVVNDAAVPEKFVLTSTVNGPKGRGLVGTVATKETIPADTTLTVVQNVNEPTAQLWSLTTPVMYSVASAISQSGLTVDTYKTPFGIRTESFDPNLGFFLNGKPVKLQGTCNHQDTVAVGIGMPDSMILWRIKELKAMGCNTYRTSHNEVASELLDDCDTLGMLVIDETRHLGDSYDPKTPDGTPATNLADLKQQLLRDRNHPSIILWSMCNEEWNADSDPSWGIPAVQAMTNVAHAYDPTRPTTCADWNVLYPGVDVNGEQYQPYDYSYFHSSDPNQPILCTESASEVGTRGEYVNDATDGWVWAYDIENSYVSWGASAEDAWDAIITAPYMAGAMVWTGFDYRGEPTPYGWPDVSSNFGSMDLCGFPKDNYYYYQSVWTNKPIVHILPHWNWKGEGGTPIPVYVYSNAASVELFLNGKSLGVQNMPAYYGVEWSVPYAPGTLIAKAYNSLGATIATDEVSSTGTPAAIVLKPNVKTLTADGEDASMVEADIVDSQGRIVPTAGNEVTFSITGAGNIAGTGDGDPSNHEQNNSPAHAAFNGKCMAVVQSLDGTPGTIQLTASSPGLTSATVIIMTN